MNLSPGGFQSRVENHDPQEMTLLILNYEQTVHNAYKIHSP